MKDPLEAYLKENDPLAGYLQSQAQPDSPELDAVGPKSFLDKKKFKPSPQHRPLSNTGSIEDVRSTLSRERPPDYDVDRAIEDAVAVPSSMINTGTLGAYGGLLRTVKGAQEAITGEDDSTSIAARTLAGMDRYRRDEPTVSSLTDTPAYFTKAPMALAEGVSRAIPAATTALGRAGRAGVSSGITSGLAGGLEAGFRGEEPLDVAKRAGESAAFGLGLGSTAGVGATLLGKAARGVIGSKGGQARQYLEGKGVEVGPRTPGRGGPMETMATKGTSDADIGIQESVSARKGLGILKEENRGVRGALGIKKGKIEESGKGAALHQMDDVVMKMQEASERIGADDRAAAQLQKELERIRIAQGDKFNPDTDSYFLSETQVNDLKGKLARLGGMGESADVRLKPLRDAAKSLHEITSAGPYAEVNKEFETEYARHGRAREQLGLPAKSRKTKDTKGEVSTVKNLIGRAGQNTITAGAQRPEFEAFRRENPDIAQEFDRPEILRKRADISFSPLPKRHGGLIERGGSAAMTAAAIEGLLHAAGQGHLNLKQLAAAAASGMALQNAPAINARLLYGPAQGALRLEPMFLEGIPLLQGAARNAAKPQ